MGKVGSPVNWTLDGWRRLAETFLIRDPELAASGRQPASDVANLGLIRPPVVYLVSTGLGLALHSFWAVQFAPRSASAPIGVLLMLVAVGLFIWAVRTLRRAGTPVPGNRPTTTIVRTGPYGFSRNPIYVAFTLVQVGVAIWVNSLAVLITLLPALALIAMVVIPREERYLAARFPSDFALYKQEVRRWL